MEEDGRVRKRKKRADKRRAVSDGDTSSSEKNDKRSRKKSRKRARPSNDRRGKRKRDPGETYGSDSGSHIKKRRKRNVGGDDDGNNSEPENMHEAKRIPTASKSTSKSRAKSGRNNVSESGSQSETDSSPPGSSPEAHSKRTESRSGSRKNLKSSSSKGGGYPRSPSPVAFSNILGSAYVYRAVRQERVALGWSVL